MATPYCYSNPSFTQQSEFYNAQRTQRALSPQRSLSPHRALSPVRNIREPPIGAQTPLRILDTSICEDTQNEEDYEEQEFYEEMLVDDCGMIKEKKIVVVAQNTDGQKYIQVPQNEENRQGGRYGVPVQSRSPVIYEMNKTQQRVIQKQRYEHIPMQQQDVKKPYKAQYTAEHVELNSGRIHRYSVIDANEETELSTRNGRYALVPVEDLNSVVPVQTRNNHRYEYIQDSPPKPIPSQNKNRYEYIQNSPQKPVQHYRYDSIQHNDQRPKIGNPIATQKLHELLSTPKKSATGSKPNTPQKIMSPQSLRKPMSTPISPIPKESFQTPIKIPQRASRSVNSKAQQKLNYALGSHQMPQDKRNTAIVPPMCSSPIQSVYSETTYSNKSESWMNLSVRKGAGHCTLIVAAVMMLLCGGVTSILSFYMISIMGRLYYLDLSLLAGFTCLILALLGFRTRNVYWLPNRNYITGYIVLSLFSLLTCAGLLVLLFMQPKTGSPLADMTSGAVCGVSVFSLVLAVGGVFSSYCCAFPPPDNRVQHCVQGFTV